MLGIASVVSAGDTGPLSKCASWCHWDAAKNCLSNQCFGCALCLQQRIGRPACTPSADSGDVEYEDCEHSCKKTNCRECRCKHCLGCGGPPPRKQPREGCLGKTAVALDLGGNLEVTLATWIVGSLVTLDPSVGLTLATVVPAAHYKLMPSAADRHGGGGDKTLTVMMIGEPPSVDSAAAPPIRVTYGGTGPFLEPSVRCHGASPPRPPPAPPPAPLPPRQSPPPPRPLRFTFRRPPPPSPTMPLALTESTAFKLGADGVATGATGATCYGADTTLDTPPSASATSSASWSLRLPLSKPTLPPCVDDLEWEVRIRRGQSQSVLRLHASDVRPDGTLPLNSARCPPVDYPEGCTFDVRLISQESELGGEASGWASPIEGKTDGERAGWSPESEPALSAATPLLPEGGARFEVRFAEVDPAGSHWEVCSLRLELTGQVLPAAISRVHATWLTGRSFYARTGLSRAGIPKGSSQADCGESSSRLSRLFHPPSHFTRHPAPPTI